MIRIVAGLAFAVVLGLGVVGCHHDHHDMSDSKSMSADACSHCPGIQTATPEGTCPVCGMKVKKM